jgi:hypothetical protein
MRFLLHCSNCSPIRRFSCLVVHPASVIVC